MKTVSNVVGRLHRMWWVPLVTGVVSIGLGAWCLYSPASSLPVLAYVFAAIMVVAGVLNMEYAYANYSLGTNWGWSMALGIIELVCGIWLFTLPSLVIGSIFVYAVGIWIIVAAINSVSEALAMSRHGAGWIAWTVLLLVAAVICGIMFLSNPVLGGLAGWLWIGWSLLLFGFYRIALAFHVRSLNHIKDTRIKDTTSAVAGL